MVCLDEATSALDTLTEHSVQQALHSLTKSRTTLTIAHRLSTVVGAHQIIVLDHGQIKEKGTHQELVAIPQGTYKEMWTSQSQVEDKVKGLGK